MNNKSKDDLDNEVTEDQIGLAGYKSDYASPAQQRQIKRGSGQCFSFQRFQSPTAILSAFNSVRSSSSSFKWFERKDRKGYFSSTKLGGDWVLAESKQVAVDCTTEEVLRVYLSGELQAKYNSKNLLECNFTKLRKNINDKPCNSNDIIIDLINNNSDDDNIVHCQPSIKPQRRLLWTKSSEKSNVKKRHKSKPRPDDDDVVEGDTFIYRQDLLCKSQRVIRSHTGIMRYQQIIEIDKVGHNNYSVLVRLLNDEQKKNRQNNKVERDNNAITRTTAKKPFESLQVYINLEQTQDGNVDIYAAGVFEVNRQVVPNLIVFDTSGIAGSIAGKGTLWLAAYFDKRREYQRKK